MPSLLNFLHCSGEVCLWSFGSSLLINVLQPLTTVFLVQSCFAFGATLFIFEFILFDVADLFGLTPVRHHEEGKAAPKTYRKLSLTAGSSELQSLYKHHRHPLLLGLLLLFWSTPGSLALTAVLSLDRCLAAVVFTSYCLFSTSVTFQDLAYVTAQSKVLVGRLLT